METIWRPVKGYEELYEVSNTGLVRSVGKYTRGPHNTVRFLAGKVLKTTVEPTGYVRVHLNKNGHMKSFYVHRIVAQAFPEICGEWFEGCQINHKSEVKTDNWAENLETCTESYNRGYGTCYLRVSNTRQSHGRRVLQYDCDDRLVAIFASPQVAVNMYGKNVFNALKGRCKTAYGYTFKYYDDIE